MVWAVVVCSSHGWWDFVWSLLWMVERGGMRDGSLPFRVRDVGAVRNMHLQGEGWSWQVVVLRRRLSTRDNRRDRIGSARKQQNKQ